MSQTNLIILPGWGGSHETWQNFVSAVGKNFDNIMVIDLPCFGAVPCPTEIWGVPDYVEYVKTEIGKLNYSGKTILLGHSFGGQVATSLVVENPDIVDALILSGAAVIRPKHSLRRIFFGAVAKIGKIVFKLPLIEKLSVFGKTILYRAVGSKDYNDSTGIKREIFKKVIRYNIGKSIAKITIPTLILWGEKDRYIPLKYGHKLHRAIPSATIHIVKKGGHGLHMHNIAEIELVINEFIAHV